ncbi:MAG: hypothetical protein ACRENG_28335 [bacterium]
MLGLVVLLYVGARLAFAALAVVTGPDISLSSPWHALLFTGWYLLFNVLAGASAIPPDRRDTTALLRLSSFDRWRTLILPALFFTALLCWA